VIPLWPDGALGSEGWTQQERKGLLSAPFNVEAVWNVSRPTLIAFLPESSVATGTAALVCPGGLFHFLASEHEGPATARWLAERGVAAFVLKYRLLPVPEAAEDVTQRPQEAFAERDRMAEQQRRMVRELLPLMTADGTIATSAALRYDTDSRPSFVAPISSA